MASTLASCRTGVDDEHLVREWVALRKVLEELVEGADAILRRHEDRDAQEHDLFDELLEPGETLGAPLPGESVAAEPVARSPVSVRGSENAPTPLPRGRHGEGSPCLDCREFRTGTSLLGQLGCGPSRQNGENLGLLRHGRGSGRQTWPNPALFLRSSAD